MAEGAPGTSAGRVADGGTEMRGWLGRSWLLSPRVWWARLVRRTEIRMEARARPVLQRAAEARQTDARPWRRTLRYTAWKWVLFTVALAVAIFQLMVPIANFLRHWLGWYWLSLPQQLQWSPAVAWGELKSVLAPLVAIALAFVGYYLLVYWRVIRFYRRKARSSPTELVETATKIIDKVYGRSELCEILIERIRDPATRSPMVLIGGVGAGKTATLVELTRKLAAQNIVPIPIRLRDTSEGKELNFKNLARAKFEKAVDSRLFSGGDMEKLWRALFHSNEVAILADGLDEAIQGAPARDSVIRAAIRQAVDDGLPLVIVSRPYDPLRGMKATVVALEPLGEGAAIEYAKGGGSLAEQAIADIAALAQAADVAESPMFLRIIRDLQEVDLLPRDASTGAALDGEQRWRARDRAEVRLALLMKWCEALLDGYLQVDYAHTRTEREITGMVLEAFACLGLDQESPQLVKFENLICRGRGDDFANLVRESLKLKLGKDAYRGKIDMEERDDIVIATQRGEAMGLVDEESDGVRFQYGALQAYLAAKFMFDLSHSERHDVLRKFGLRLCFEADVDHRQPSRELLDALVLMSRMWVQEQRSAKLNSKKRGSSRFSPQHVVERLLQGAERSQGNTHFIPCWQLEMYAAALEIDVICERPRQDEIVDTLLRRWRKDFQEDATAPDRPLDEAKLHIVRRAGDAARILRDRARGGEVGDVAPKYESLFRIAIEEDSYRVRLAAAREVGLGGVAAARPLCEGDLLAPPPLVHVAHAPEVARSVETTERRSSLLRWSSLWRSGRRTRGYAAERTTAFTEGTRQETANRLLNGPIRSADGSQGNENDSFQVVGWTLPLLYLSTFLEEQCSRDADGQSWPARGFISGPDERFTALVTNQLDQWLYALPERDYARPQVRFPIRAELALAQGFRLAANLRRLPQGSRVRDRSFIVERAELALRNSGFWYSQIALIQALTLFSLPDEPNVSMPPGGQVTDPWAQVQYWVGLAGSAVPGSERGKAHPFVTEVGRLCVSALLTLRPERFIWIDESETASRVGACSPSEEVRWHQTSWIPDSMGWSLLMPRAQRLLADVMLLYNLADRGEDPDRREVRLARSDRPDLPPCVTDDRQALQVKRNLTIKEHGEPGKSCLHGCPFRLCPLPARGERLTYQMDQSFCARQADIVGTGWFDIRKADFWKQGYWRDGPWQPDFWRAWFFDRAPWQAVPRSVLIRFWRQMSERDLPDDRW